MNLSTELAAVKAQLKEQTHQMTEMASMMKSMMSLAMPLLEEQAHKLCMEKEAEAARKKAEAEKRAKLWSCPNDGYVYPWTYKGTKYLRNSDNQVWREEAYGVCGDWYGVYLIDEDRIDDSMEEPYLDFE